MPKRSKLTYKRSDKSPSGKVESLYFRDSKGRVDIIRTKPFVMNITYPSKYMMSNSTWSKLKLRRK